MLSSRLDFLEALSKRGRTCSNSIASRKADGVDAHQVRTKTTYGANSKKGRRYSVVRACCCTLKRMVLSLEGRFVRCANGANKTQHRYRIDLELAQSLNQAFGRSSDFQHALDDFSGVPSNDECNHLGRSWSQHTWHI